MRISLLVVYCLAHAAEGLAHGRSPEMISLLNAPVPDWMSLAEPVNVEPPNDQPQPSIQSFRPRSGGATNSRNRVQIPERGIEFQVDYSIFWTGDNAAGEGVSLSRDGTKLLVSSGVGQHLYEINPNGQHKEVAIQLPEVTYDDGPKGFISRWSWAGNDRVIGQAEITDDRGHVLVENRLYIFYLKEQALARLDLSALKLSTEEIPQLVSIGEDLNHMIIGTSKGQILVKADLKSPPRLIEKQDVELTAELQPETLASKLGTEAGEKFNANAPEKPLPSPWMWIFVILIMFMVTGLKRWFRHGQDH